MECGIVYLKISFSKGHNLEWLNYVALTSILPKKMEIKIRDISQKINSEFGKDILVKLDSKINPGCVSTPESIEKISHRIYSEFADMMKGEGVDDSCIRCVYTVGDIPEESLKDCRSIHSLDSFPALIRIGTFLDESNIPGIFKI